MGNRARIGLSTALAVSAFVACGDPNFSAPLELPPVNEPSFSDVKSAAFEPTGPLTYVPKVKNILTGLPATDAEVQAVIADPDALRGLIDDWMELPEFRGRMLDFFRNAFQQNQVTVDGLKESLGFEFQSSPESGQKLVRNIMDSFALTVWALVQEGRPFTDAMTTRRYMVTTAMASAVSFFDDLGVNDAGKLTNRLKARSALTTPVVFDSQSRASVTQALTPGAGYMKFSFPGTQPGTCSVSTLSLDPKKDAATYQRLFGFFMGRISFDPCNEFPNGKFQNFDARYPDSDWNDWHMVTLQVDPTAAGAAPAFYELPALRSATEMTLRANRVGFFGTLAFNANWPTNLTNEARVTANQSLIVALSTNITGGEEAETRPSADATDAAHLANPACQSCHVKLDPLKNYFRQSYSLHYGDQTDAKEQNTTAGFAFAGVAKEGKGVGDLAEIFANHPRLALAWTTKLAFWANSMQISEGDAEALRVAKAFSDSNYDFKTLVRELFSSPLVTWSETTASTEGDVLVSIARRDQFCSALSNRLGLTDVCNTQSVAPTSAQRATGERALLLPADTYFRNAVLPALPTMPDLFYRQSVEAVCRQVADQVVDVKGGTSRYSSADAPAAIKDFVSNVMALVPSDPRSPRASYILTDNYEASMRGGATATEALKSTFTLACISPSSVVIGL